MGTRSEVSMIEVCELFRRGLLDLHTATIVMEKAPSIVDSLVETALALATVAAALSAHGEGIGLLVMLCILAAHRIVSAVSTWRDYRQERRVHAQAMWSPAWAREARDAMLRAEASASEAGAP